jgi:hypothetical protein
VSRAATGERGARLLDGITRRVEQVLADLGDLAAATADLAAAAQLGGRPLRRADLASLRVQVADLLRRRADLAAGAGVVLAPATLADLPRCIEWWWADPGAAPTQLQVDLDPGSVEFYDYTTTEWYRTPERTGLPSVAGPYVDYICTHRYTITLSVPIVCAGRFAGVAGADILAEQVERLVLPDLCRLGRPAVLVSGNGRVLASNTAAVLPGAAAFRQPLYARLVPITGLGSARWADAGAGPSGVLPWTLFCEKGELC